MTPRILSDRVAALLDVIALSRRITRTEAAAIIGTYLGVSDTVALAIGSNAYRYRRNGRAETLGAALLPLEAVYRLPLRYRREYHTACRKVAA